MHYEGNFSLCDWVTGPVFYSILKNEISWDALLVPPSSCNYFFPSFSETGHSENLSAGPSPALATDGGTQALAARLSEGVSCQAYGKAHSVVSPRRCPVSDGGGCIPAMPQVLHSCNAKWLCEWHPTCLIAMTSFKLRHSLYFSVK